MADYRAQPRKTNDSPIARLRMERGLTQGQLASQVGCLNKDISRWENGVCRPGAAYLIKLAAALNCSIDEIVK
ncbi:MAG: helix-turn-helix domain-containing protein [Candidatus Aphodomorpha sp.]